MTQRLGQAAASYREALSQYHADSRGKARRSRMRRPQWCGEWTPASWECKCAPSGDAVPDRKNCPPSSPSNQGSSATSTQSVLLLPHERVETSPGRSSLVRRFLVTCLGDADDIFRRLYAHLRELGWVGPQTVVVIVGDGAEGIWNRASMFVQRCEILDFWHALEPAWEFAHLRYGAGSAQADRWAQDIAEKLRAGKVYEGSEELKRLRPQTPESRESLPALIRYYSENATRMR